MDKTKDKVLSPARVHESSPETFVVLIRPYEDDFHAFGPFEHKEAIKRVKQAANLDHVEDVTYVSIRSGDDYERIIGEFEADQHAMGDEL